MAVAFERKAVSTVEKPVGAKKFDAAGVVFPGFFVQENQGGVRIAWRIVGDKPTAEDATQDGWENFIKAQQRGKIRENPGGLFRQTVVNSARSIRRHEIVAQVHGGRPLEDDTIGIENGTVVFKGPSINLEEEVHMRLLYQRVLGYIKELPQLQKNVMALVLLDKSVEEIAFWLGVTNGTVKTATFRARQTLKRRLGVGEREKVFTDEGVY